jgi:hypothetical protein
MVQLSSSVCCSWIRFHGRILSATRAAPLAVSLEVGLIFLHSYRLHQYDFVQCNRYLSLRNECRNEFGSTQQKLAVVSRIPTKYHRQGRVKIAESEKGTSLRSSWIVKACHCCGCGKEQGRRAHTDVHALHGLPASLLPHGTARFQGFTEIII